MPICVPCLERQMPDMGGERFGGQVRLYQVNTVIVGTGAAGFNAADRLWSLGQQDIAMVTDHVKGGTSRNTGSDKQTYYKLTMAGGEPDSVEEMAKTLFSGRCVDGDLALCEAALSARCFFRLGELGVPFPHNGFGEYVGYKTDHDPRRRATSAGPYTSRYMTERLEESVRQKGIRIFDRMQVIDVLSDKKRVYGLLCLDLTCAHSQRDRFVLFRCENVIYATGGPAGMYADCVYPAGHYGASGLAFEAGVKGKNLTEWQYGMASVRPRWNVSGTYMQVLPRFYSTDEKGGDEREFLADFFDDPYDMMDLIFLKGYQWPFDARKVMGGSSVIDILVYREQEKGRRVFLDYRRNPCRGALDPGRLGSEAKEYLSRAGAFFETPFQRLKHMNLPAVEFYRERGVDLETQPLEIALCTQHNNGGLSVDKWWQTNIEGFFAVGEVSASHGVYRPGGSALNAGQVGSLRAAQYIAARRQDGPGDQDVFAKLAEKAVEEMKALADHALEPPDSPADKEAEPRISAGRLWKRAARRMSLCGGAIRNGAKIAAALEQVKGELDGLFQTVAIQGPKELWQVFRLRDILISQYVYLAAMKDYGERNGKSRGSALYTDPSGQKPADCLPDEFAFCLEADGGTDLVQEAELGEREVSFTWRPVRPLPETEEFFENVWRDFREGRHMDP